MNKNLIFFLPVFKFGGAGNSIFRLCSKIDAIKNNIFIISIGKNDYRKKFYNLSKKIKIIELNSLSTIGSFFKLRKIVKNIVKTKDYKTIFISNQHYANVISIFSLGFIKKIKLILVDRIDISELKKYYNFSSFIKNNLIYLLVKFFYRYADTIISNSKSAKKDLENITNSKVINISPPSIVKLNKIKRRKIKREKKIILTVGSLVKAKGVDTMIKSIKLVNNNVIFKVAGEGLYRSNLEKLIFKLKLKNKVKLLGWNKNPEKLYREADIFIHASHQEGFPNSIVEAVNFGLPVIASKCKGGTEEILMNGAGGDLFPVNDHISLAKKINNYLKNPYELNKKLKIARRNIIKYTVDNNFKKYMNIFNKI